MQTLQSQIFSGREILPQAPGSPGAMVLLLHGVGSNGDDLIGLAPSYEKLIGGSIAYLSPNAPFAWDAAPMPQALPEAYQWFSIKGYDPMRGGFDDFLPQWGEAVCAVQETLSDFISEQQARFGLSGAQTVLIGFSQGTMVSLYASLHHQKRGMRFAGIVGYSGALLGQDDFAPASTDKLLPPYLLLHGREDDVVPCQASELACEFLKSAGASAQLHIYENLPHAINQEGLQAAAEFIKEKLAIA